MLSLWQRLPVIVRAVLTGAVVASAGTVPWALLFDYFDLSSGAFGFALGDVAGKGQPAALLTAVLQGILAAHVYVADGPAETLKRVNESLVRRAVESRFATLLYGVLSHDGRLTCCNAGHNPPVLWGGTVWSDLRRVALALGRSSRPVLRKRHCSSNQGTRW